MRVSTHGTPSPFYYGIALQFSVALPKMSLIALDTPWIGDSMTPQENEGMPPEDIQQALASARQPDPLSNTETPPALSEGLTDALASDKLAGGPFRHIWGQGRYAIYKCARMAEKYPWQTAAALLLTVGCGWVCGYFGATVMATLLIYAITAPE
jgi:hypothetical protein